jgi:hypothetical protein
VNADKIKTPTPVAVILPREKAYGVKIFEDINTWLVAKGSWRGTVTGYDQEYSMKNGHATGGALSMLWHTKVGALLVASMNSYQLTEPFNMQRDKDAFSMCLTPRLELIENNSRCINIADLEAAVSYKEEGGRIVFQTKSKLVDENQLAATAGGSCAVTYDFGENDFSITATCTTQQPTDAVKFILPVIAANDEKITRVSDKKLQVVKRGATVNIESNTSFEIAPTQHGRVFNYVPGLEAVPLVFAANNVTIKIYLS